MTPRTALHTTFALALGLIGLVAPAIAQYKIVGPDGHVTYTDRPPAAAPSTQVIPLRRDGAVAAPNAPLPLELRQATNRFPVTLYSAADCAPCDSGRRLLQTRGIPYTERLINDDADAEALLRLSDARTVPVLTVGKQVLRGFSEADWQSTLDLASYPRESRLPRNYVQAPAAALTPKVAVAPRPATVEPTSPAATEPAPAQAETPGPSIRF
jgi:glutaredoxin